MPNRINMGWNSIGVLEPRGPGVRRIPSTIRAAHARPHSAAAEGPQVRLHARTFRGVAYPGAVPARKAVRSQNLPSQGRPRSHTCR
mgnify:CR=1 FL=1